MESEEPVRDPHAAGDLADFIHHFIEGYALGTADGDS
jgi:hypothetical protein